MSLASLAKVTGNKAFDYDASYLRLAHDQDYEKKEEEVVEEKFERDTAFILLSGGFADELVEDIIAARDGAKQNSQDKQSGSRTLMLRGATGAERVPIGLVPLNNMNVLIYWMERLSKIDRFKDHMKHYVYVTCNNIDRPEFDGEGGLIDDSDDSWCLGPENVISIEAPTRRHYSGELDEIRAALEVVGMDNPIFVASSGMVFFPQYNLQRVVEHCLVRARDTIGSVTISETDAKLLGITGHNIIRPGALGALPPVAEYILDSNVQEGDIVACPIAMITKGSLPRLKTSKARTIAEFFAELHADGVQTHTVDLGWGRFYVNHLEALDYAEQFFDWNQRNRKVLAAASKTFNKNDNAHVLGDDVNELGKTMIVSRKAMGAEIEKTLSEVPAAEFDSVYFKQQAAKFNGMDRPFYVVPPTFYMSEYRRLASAPYNAMPIGGGSMR